MSEGKGDDGMPAGLFPIRRHEADVLRDMGWSSGYGWEREWDWWLTDAGPESRDDDESRALLVKHLAAIRAARREADAKVVAEIGRDG